MHSAMTSRQRYLATFRHEEPDRVPIFLECRPVFFYTEKVKWYTPFEKVQVLLELGCDPMINFWLPTPVPHPDVNIRTWREKASDGKTYIGKEFDTPKGVLRQVVEETDDWCSHEHGFWVQHTLSGDQRQEFGMHVFDDWNVSRRTEPWVKGPEDLPKLEYILRKPPQWQLDEWVHDAQRAKEFAEKHDLLTMARRTIVSDASQWFCDIPWFMMQLYDDPGFVKEFLQVFEDIANWQTDLVLNVGVDVVQRRGWYDEPNFWGGRHFEEHILPSMNAEAAKVHSAGSLHCYLLTRGWAPYLDLFDRLDTDILWGADPIDAGTPLATVKERLPGKTLLGGISAEKQLILGSEKEVRQAVRQAVSSLAPGGGFVLASSSSIWSQIEWQRIQALIDEAHRVGHYPIRSGEALRTE